LNAPIRLEDRIVDFLQPGVVSQDQRFRHKQYSQQQQENITQLQCQDILSDEQAPFVTQMEWLRRDLAHTPALRLCAL
jgi:hypothetical protein